MSDTFDGPIPHDAAAWAEGRFCAAVRVQVICDLAIRTAFTLPISAYQLIEDEMNRSMGRSMEALDLYSRMRHITPGMVDTMARQHSYWVGYHNELNKGVGWAMAWMQAGTIDKAATKLVAAAVKDAEVHLLAQQGET